MVKKIAETDNSLGKINPNFRTSYRTIILKHVWFRFSRCSLSYYGEVGLIRTRG